MMGDELTFLGFWAINDALEPARLRSQLEDLKAAGLDGVIFHPRFYPNEPVYMSEDYLAIVSEIILYSKSIGMSFWIYDEDGWPSGTAGGQVMARRPDLRCEWIAWERGANGQNGIAYHYHHAVSSFDDEATRLFIDITHEGYRKGLAPEAFDYVTGFFTDEVAFLDGHGITVNKGGLPWDSRMPAMYEERYGEKLELLLPLLFKDGDGSECVRVRYWELATDLLVAGFYNPVQDWCAANGKKFTGHLKAEENPFFQLSYSGSAFQVLKGIETPAVDALERYPSNHFYPRIAHSVAMQQGREGCLVEAMGGSGWGVSPESFTNYVLWLVGHGIRTFTLHLNQMKLKSQAIRDWPPSMPSHVSWRDGFPALLASLKEQSRKIPDLKGEPDVLLVTPTRGVMAAFLPQEAMQMNEHDGSNVPNNKAGLISKKFLALVDHFHKAKLHYELSEERVIEEDGVAANGKLRIGRREYAAILIAEGCVWRDDGIVNRLREAGVRVLGEGDWRQAFGVEISPASDAEEIAGAALRNARVEISAGVADSPVIPWQTEWTVLRAPDINLLFAEFDPQANGNLAVEWRLEKPIEKGHGEWTFVLHDPIAELRANGTVLPLVAEGDLTVARIPAAIVAESSSLRIEAIPLPGGESNPFAFLRGPFVVKSDSLLTEKDAHQWRTEGAFVLMSPSRHGQPDAADLIASGYPFSDRPMTASKRIRLSDDETGLQALLLTDVYADAAFVRFNGSELGWCWGPDWRVELPVGIEAGEFELTVELYPSTYNKFGPHRHVDGDRYLTSPAQYAGTKNFADRPDAPERTLGAHWHFVKWGIGGRVALS
ncbi:hypothetical protein ACFPYJ_05520 [Paenibacillus solisilvae]|uniref:Glycoside hydrolase n=1 Tax=Paenibacillus solisilvae TaxID=2486751 RepID=A0ABW0VS40_9BACL